MTRDAVIRELDPADAFRTHRRARAKAAHCPDCNRRLATYGEVEVIIPAPVEPDPDFKVDARSGYQVLLDVLFTNHGARHPSGRPWYHRGRKPRRQPLAIRVPAIVTCCSAEVVIPSLVDDLDRELATQPASEKLLAWNEVESVRNQELYESIPPEELQDDESDVL